MTRQCGGCTLCCKLLPMRRDSYDHGVVRACCSDMIAAGWTSAEEIGGMLPDFDKPAGEPCKHQSHHRGCKVYERRPFGCRFWNCRWLVEDDTADLRRPDRSRYVIDLVPDFITIRPDDGGEATNIEVVQIWIDPKQRDAWRDPALLDYVERRGLEGKATLLRYGSGEAVTLFPPSLSLNGEFVLVESPIPSEERKPRERFEGIAAAARDFKVGP